jgi:hypothetical protein
MSALLEKQLEDEYYWSTKQVYLRCLIKWVDEQRFTHFITFTFNNEEIKQENAEKALKLFNMRLNRSLYGNRPKKRIIMFPFIEENYLYGWHFHIFVKIPCEFDVATIKKQMKLNWCFIRESGKATFEKRDENNNHKWFVPIYDGRRVTEYVLKQSTNLTMKNLVSDLISK